ncbi:synaptic vesicle glycoprotein 2A-like [Epargyreus clarus]|uniref:synaptic vesicle glycoprotein 2A-like n=1 Tax=Epargyreus clarus TaxID=520877 RepID=UPI003C2D3D6A
MGNSKMDVEARVTREEIAHDHLYKVTGLSSSNLEKLGQEPADFETAIAATGYGRFNIALMLCTLPAFWSATSVTSSTSYIFTRAQCDMQLRLLDMGTLNAISYGGMVSSALVWGFLSDTLGRRRILIWGFLGSGVTEIAAAMSQNFTTLLVTRFMSGFLFNGPFAVLISYLAELHRTELRARVIVLTSLFYTFANITLPMLAWAILTQNWEFALFGNKYVIHSWNIFLFATAMAPIITGLSFVPLPESPKFLMSRGRNEEALKVFQNIYRMNTCQPADKYSITRLVKEKTEQQGRGMEALKGGCAQFAPLFKPPHVTWLLLICFIHSGCMFGTNTLRLWYPQLAAMIGTENATSLCSAIAPAPVDAVEEACKPINTDMITYLQSVIVGTGSVITFGIGGALVNKCGKKTVAASCGLISGLFVALLPLLGADAYTVMAMTTVGLAFASLYGASLSSICVDLFPTSLRVMGLATFLMTGRIGTVSGSVIFAALIDYGCYPPFLTIALVLAVTGVACFLLPNTTLKKLE